MQWQNKSCQITSHMISSQERTIILIRDQNSSEKTEEIF